MPASPHNDMRLCEMQKKIHLIGKSLEEMYVFVGRQPHEQQEHAREALRCAFEAGCTFSELNLLPPQPPMELNGTMKLGPALKAHVLRARAVYAEVNVLRDNLADLLKLESNPANLLEESHGSQMATKSSSTALTAETG